MDIPFSNRPLNSYSNQIIINYHDKQDVLVKKKNIFHHKRLDIFLVNDDDLNDQIFTITKNYLDPKPVYGIHFIDESIMPTFCRSLRENFTSNAYKFGIARMLTDVTDEQKQLEIIKTTHEEIKIQCGINETHNAIKRNYYWPKMSDDVHNYINHCVTCQENKYDRDPSKMELTIAQAPTRPFEIVHMDIYCLKSKIFLTLIDKFSRYAQAYPIAAKRDLKSTKVS